MKFRDLADLVSQVNTTLGEFCDDFGSKRKELAGLGKAPKRGILFKLTDQSRDWAINEGGGTELQYHIAFDVNDLEIRYGLGFNTQYVPFANEKSSVDYMRPYMFGFLKNEKKIRGILPDYTFVYGDIQQLKDPENNQYTLFGKSISVKDEKNVFLLDDHAFQSMISDLKKQFEAYQIIFSDKNHFSEVAMSNQSIIDVLTHKGQIILQGPPGTGKTYTAKDIAEQMLFSEVSEDKIIQKDRLEGTDQFKIIQFHPAFSYEDFVRGIVAESKGISIEYRTKDKLMVDFANRALRNYENSRKDKALLKEENWIQENFSDFSDYLTDEIEKSNGKLLLKGTTTYLREVENDCFRYTGDNWNNIAGNRMRFEDIIKMYRANVKTRQEIKKMTEISGLAIQHASYYMRVLDMFYSFMDTKNKPEIDIPEIEEKKYVLIIDEINRANLPAVLGELIYALEYRGEKVESMYPVDDDNTLIIPPNLYIIGTMNTSDRSVGHIDYAIRRRFAFIDVLPKILNIENFELELFQQVSALFIQNFDAYALDTTVELIPSEHLSEEFRPEDVWLGHSYFIKGEGDFSIRKSYEIIPILKEYLKDGILKQSAETLIRAL